MSSILLYAKQRRRRTERNGLFQWCLIRTTAGLPLIGDSSRFLHMGLGSQNPDVFISQIDFSNSYHCD